MTADSTTNTRVVVQSEAAPPPAGPYSQGVVVNGMLYTSGALALDPPTGRLITARVGNQTKRALENLAAICEAAGTALHSAALLTVYTTQLSALGEIDAAFREFFDGEPPARAAVGVAELPLGPMAWVEIQAIVPVR
jgi:2-iminobutanoate/2-iminopropanoate deaminase